jgi:hypothetical protein
MEKLAFTRACLSYIKVTMETICVSIVESLFQTSMGWIPTIEYVLSGARGIL